MQTINREDAKGAKVGTIGSFDQEIEQLAHAVLGAAIEVHKILGPGFLESVYEEALSVEMRMREIPFERQVPVAVDYKGVAVGESRLDFLVGKRLIVELKAVESLAPVHTAQVISYLRSTSYQIGLLLNFNGAVMKDGIKRIVLTQ